MDQQTRESDRELWNPAINWLLNVAPGELGEKGTLGGTINCLEHGGQSSGVPSTDLTNYQMGWCVGDSPADKWRKWAPVWFGVSRETQALLLAHYMPRADLPDTQRVAVEGALGKLACAAMWVHEGEQLIKLVEACVDKGRQGRARIIGAATKRTDEAVRVAHRCWDVVASFGPEPRLHDGGRIESRPANETWVKEYDLRAAERPKWETARQAGLDGLGRALKKLSGRGRWVRPEEPRNAA
jgi:hypothetical protein